MTSSRRVTRPVMLSGVSTDRMLACAAPRRACGVAPGGAPQHGRTSRRGRAARVCAARLGALTARRQAAAPSGARTNACAFTSDRRVRQQTLGVKRVQARGGRSARLEARVDQVHCLGLPPEVELGLQLRGQLIHGGHQVDWSSVACRSPRTAAVGRRAGARCGCARAADPATRGRDSVTSRCRDLQSALPRLFRERRVRFGLGRACRKRAAMRMLTRSCCMRASASGYCTCTRAGTPARRTYVLCTHALTADRHSLPLAGCRPHQPPGRECCAFQGQSLICIGSAFMLCSKCFLSKSCSSDVFSKHAAQRDAMMHEQASMPVFGNSKLVHWHAWRAGTGARRACSAP